MKAIPLVFLLCAALSGRLPATEPRTITSPHPAPASTDAVKANRDATKAPAESNSPPYADRLTGDWFGARTSLQEHGITILPRFTHFYQGMIEGDGDNTFDWAGKAEVLLNIDASKLGLWEGLSLTVHAESNFGIPANSRGGTMLLVNTAMAFPGNDGAT